MFIVSLKTVEAIDEINNCTVLFYSKRFFIILLTLSAAATLSSHNMNTLYYQKSSEESLDGLYWLSVYSLSQFSLRLIIHSRVFYRNGMEGTAVL